MEPSRNVPIAARRAAWDALWQILLDPLPHEDSQATRFPSAKDAEHSVTEGAQ
jgi:hypothetical protein